jgi:hypothetical protein
MINNPMPEAMQIELVRGHAMGIIGPTTTWSDDEDDDEEEEEEVEVVVDAPITPRGIRYTRCSGALHLAALMCCIGEVQSAAATAIHMSTANPTVHMTMSIQLTTTQTLAMSALLRTYGGARSSVET